MSSVVAPLSKVLGFGSSLVGGVLSGLTGGFLGSIPATVDTMSRAIALQEATAADTQKKAKAASEKIAADQAQKDKEDKEAATLLAKRRKATDPYATSPKGLLGEAPVKLKTLLGE